LKPAISLISSLIEKAKRLGFVSVGITRPERPLFFDKFQEWLAMGNQGSMRWLERYLDLREDPSKLLTGCNSLISLAYPYSSIKPMTWDGFSVARYTEPQKTDYHNRLKELARRLTRTMLEWFPESRMRICVDSAPILERSIAAASGIGFIGKNNALIVPGYGSYVFLVEILTTAHLPLSKNGLAENRCGSCTQCIDACPTGALEGPFSLDASKCLSYLTIEHRGEFNRSFGEKMGNCFFGCDVCQEVCPFNEEKADPSLTLPSTEEILEMEEEDFNIRFGRTALSRAGLSKIKNNIRAIKGD
jgi:epoxyqueuosine reductase